MKIPVCLFIASPTTGTVSSDSGHPAIIIVVLSLVLPLAISTTDDGTPANRAHDAAAIAPPPRKAAALKQSGMQRIICL